MDKFLRNVILNKIAAIYEDPKHKQRIKKREDVLVGEKELSLKRDLEQEQKAIEEFLRQKEREEREAKRRGEKNPHQAIDPEQIKEVYFPYEEALKQRGIDPATQPLSKSEVERRRKIEDELSYFSTIGRVEHEKGSSHQYVDPNHPEISPLHKYFGYYDKESKSWHPTQYSYILFFLSAYAPELGLTDFWDRSRRVDMNHVSFRRHPYRRRYADRMRGEFFLFKPEMEDRLFTDFPKIMEAIKNNVHDTNIHTTEGLPYVAPTPPEADRRFSGGVEVRYYPHDNTYMVRGPRTKPIRFQSAYVPESSDTLKIIKKVLTKSELYPRLQNSIAELKQEISGNILREIIGQNRELNFLRNSPENKEQVRGAIVKAITEILEAEVSRIIDESDF